MTTIVAISGSPAPRSRSRFLAQAIGLKLQHLGLEFHEIALHGLPADQLVSAGAVGQAIVDAAALVAQADAVIVATPVYKAAYSGLLKVFLDHLPQDSFVDKPVLPIATAGSSAHLLAIEYALKPVLSALGARHILSGIFASEGDISKSADCFNLSSRLSERLVDVFQELVDSIDRRQKAPDLTLRQPIAGRTAN